MASEAGASPTLRKTRQRRVGVVARPPPLETLTEQKSFHDKTIEGASCTTLPVANLADDNIPNNPWTGDCAKAYSSTTLPRPIENNDLPKTPIGLKLNLFSSNPRYRRMTFHDLLQGSEETNSRSSTPLKISERLPVGLTLNLNPTRQERRRRITLHTLEPQVDITNSPRQILAGARHHVPKTRDSVTNYVAKQYWSIVSPDSQSSAKNNAPQFVPGKLRTKSNEEQSENSLMRNPVVANVTRNQRTTDKNDDDETLAERVARILREQSVEHRERRVTFHSLLPRGSPISPLDNISPARKSSVAKQRRITLATPFHIFSQDLM